MASLSAITAFAFGTKVGVVTAIAGADYFSAQAYQCWSAGDMRGFWINTGFAVLNLVSLGLASAGNFFIISSARLLKTAADLLAAFW